MTDNYDEILRRIRSNTTERQLAVRELANDLKLKNDIIKYVKKNSGTQDDGIMVFHDSIVAFVKKVFTNHDFELSSSVSGYIFGIARFQWLSKLNLNIKNPLNEAIEVDNTRTESIKIDTQFEKKEKALILKMVMTQLKVNCKKVLMYWAGGYKMQEIADILGYKTAAVVRKKKHECYKELILWLDNNPQYKLELKQ